MSERPDRLQHGERLLIRTLRRLALATPCQGLQAEFEETCGCAGETAHRALEVFVQQLALQGRRRLALSVPTDPRLTADERLILEVFGLAQQEDYRALDERLYRLMGRRPPVPLGGAACIAAQTMAMAGLILRPTPPSEAADRPGGWPAPHKLRCAAAPVS